VYKLRQAVDHVFHEVEPVNIVLHAHIEGRRDGPLFLVARTWIFLFLRR
jgi:hypothetical protein